MLAYRGGLSILIVILRFRTGALLSSDCSVDTCMYCARTGVLPLHLEVEADDGAWVKSIGFSVTGITRLRLLPHEYL